MRIAGRESNLPSTSQCAVDLNQIESDLPAGRCQLILLLAENRLKEVNGQIVRCPLLIGFCADIDRASGGMCTRSQVLDLLL